LATDVYVLHKDMTDHYKLGLVKSIFFALKVFNLKLDLKETFEAVKSEYTRLSHILFEDIMKNENFKGGKLINFDIIPEIVKTTEEAENIEI
jgi:hypothetical protein